MMPSKSAKKKRTMEQYCSVCKKSFEMEIIEEAENNEVLWLKCPGCQGYLPFMTGENGDAENGGTSDESASDGGVDLAPEDIDKENVREYEESGEYQMDEIIYHRSWNDYGKVVSKETLPGNRKTIVVHFINQGKIRLLEGVT
jgi:hypothetical protein